MTPHLQSDPVSGSEPDPGCHSIVMPLVGALIPLTFIYYNFKLIHIMLNILLVLHFVAADYKIYIQAPYMEVFNIYIVCKKKQKDIYIIPTIFQWTFIDVLTLAANVDHLALRFPLLYLHG